MAQFGLNDAENYGGNGAGFFSLKNDGDSKTVRFMYTSVDDIQGYAVHRIDVNGRNRYVNCLREYNEPIDSCPLCKARNFQSGKFFFSLYDIDEDTVLIWDRGKNILKTLVPVLTSIKGDICGTPITITRHGEAGDTNTKYSFELGEPDGVTMEDLPDPANPLESLVLDYDYDTLNTYVTTGKLPIMNTSSDNSDNGYANFTPRNNGNANNYTGNAEGQIHRRYTPTNRGNNTINDNDVF